MYDAQKGGFSDVGMLDVQQIFGRAGRPQFEDSGASCVDPPGTSCTGLLSA